MTESREPHEPSDWQLLLRRAIDMHADQPSALFAQLATVAADGLPAVRTVRIRRVLPDGGLVFSTDSRSSKLRDLAAAPIAELCWYFSESREQFRLRGPTKAAGDNATDEQAQWRAQCWREASAGARQSFTWPTPGAPWADAAAFKLPEPAEPPASFVLILLAPDRVDHLDLRAQPHERRRFELGDEGWRMQRLNP